MKNRMLILFLLFTGMVSEGQTPDIVWQQCFNYSSGSDGDVVHSICATGDGYLLAIDTYEPDLPDYHGSYDILVVRVDTLGNVLWERCYGGSARDHSQKIVAAGNNEYYVLGKTKSTDGDIQSGNYGSYDFWVFKINGAGDLLWEHTYGSPDADTPRDILLLPDGGFLLAGEINSNGGDVTVNYGDWDIWLCRFDSLHNIVWDQTLGNEGEDRVNKIMINNEGNIMLTGSVEEQGGTVTCTPKGLDDVWLAALDMSGQILWDRCYGGRWDDTGYGLTELEGGYLVSAASHSNDGDVSGHHGGSYSADIWLCNIDTDGNIVWQKSLGGSNDEIPANTFMRSEDNNFMIFGYTLSNDGDVSGNHSATDDYTADLWVTKITSGGELTSQKCFGGIGNEVFAGVSSVIQKNTHSFLMAAQTDMSASDDVQCGFYETTNNVWLTEIQECMGYYPATPETPAGPDTLCSTVHQQSTYTIPPPANAWTFEWELTPGEAGTVVGYGLSSVVSWQPSFEGTASVRVRAANYCTTSEWSEPKYTQVYTCLGTEEHPTGNIRLKVYPNPAKDFVIFELHTQTGNGQTEITLFNVYGQPVTKIEIAEGLTTYHTANLPAGLYNYKTELNGAVLSGKVMVR